jgi:hypothetical protein
MLKVSSPGQLLILYNAMLPNLGFHLGNRFDRDWKKIEAFIGSKTVIQVRTFLKFGSFNLFLSTMFVY